MLQKNMLRKPKVMELVQAWMALKERTREEKTALSMGILIVLMALDFIEIDDIEIIKKELVDVLSPVPSKDA